MQINGAPGGEPDFAWSSRLPEARSGKPLWNLPKDLVTFYPARGRPNLVLNRRLPVTFRRVIRSIGALSRSRIFERHNGQKIACGNSREPPV